MSQQRLGILLRLVILIGIRLCAASDLVYGHHFVQAADNDLRAAAALMASGLDT